MIIVTSSLTKDMNSNDDLYRANAIRVLARIIDTQMLGAIERYIKQAIVDKVKRWEWEWERRWECSGLARYGKKCVGCKEVGHLEGVTNPHRNPSFRTRWSPPRPWSPVSVYTAPTPSRPRWWPAG